jgi:hypothetical protein
MSENVVFFDKGSGKGEPRTWPHKHARESETLWKPAGLRQALEVLDEFPEPEIFLIPSRLDDSEPSFTRLKDIHRIDLFPDWEHTGLLMEGNFTNNPGQ